MFSNQAFVSSKLGSISNLIHSTTVVIVIVTVFISIDSPAAFR